MTMHTFTADFISKHKSITHNLNGPTCNWTLITWFKVHEVLTVTPRDNYKNILTIDTQKKKENKTQSS